MARRIPVPITHEVFATWSACATYRYRLGRRWAEGPPLVWLLLNPSTADEHHDDPTVNRCVLWAERWGYPAAEVVNLFALRATDPEELYRADDPVGPDNDAAIQEAAAGAAMIVAGWGAHGALWDRGQAVRERILAGLSLFCMGRTKAGEPRHPLYLPKTTEPEPLISA